MLQRQRKCANRHCHEMINLEKSPRKVYCGRYCQSRSCHELELHEKLIHTAEQVNEYGAGMALVRFGITNPETDMVRWFPGMKQDLPRPAFTLPMRDFPRNLIPGAGIYNLAYYGVDQRLAYQPKVRLLITVPSDDDRCVNFSDGCMYLHKELPR